jgi:hypothetical protein
MSQYVSLEEFELQVAALRKFIREEAILESSKGQHLTNAHMSRLHVRILHLEERVIKLEKSVVHSALLVMGLLVAWTIGKAYGM